MTRRLAAAVGVVLLVAGCGGSDNSSEKSVSHVHRGRQLDPARALAAARSGRARIPAARQRVEPRDDAAEAREVGADDPHARAARRRARPSARGDPARRHDPPARPRRGAARRRAGAARGVRARRGARADAGDRCGEVAARRAERAADAQARRRTRSSEYAAPLDAAAKQLAKLEAPPVVAPSQRTQIQTYRLIAARARALATALRNGKSGAQEVHDLQVAVATSSSTASAEGADRGDQGVQPPHREAAPARGGRAARAQPPRADARADAPPDMPSRRRPNGPRRL